MASYQSATKIADKSSKSRRKVKYLNYPPAIRAMLYNTIDFSMPFPPDLSTVDHKEEPSGNYAIQENKEPHKLS